MGVDSPLVVIGMVVAVTAIAVLAPRYLSANWMFQWLEPFWGDRRAWLPHYIAGSMLTLVVAAPLLMLAALLTSKGWSDIGAAGILLIVGDVAFVIAVLVDLARRAMVSLSLPIDDPSHLEVLGGAYTTPAAWKRLALLLGGCGVLAMATEMLY